MYKHRSFVHLKNGKSGPILLILKTARSLAKKILVYRISLKYLNNFELYVKNMNTWTDIRGANIFNFRNDSEAIDIIIGGFISKLRNCKFYKFLNFFIKSF